MTEQQKPNGAKTIDQQLETLDKQAAKANEEIQRIIEKRDKLNEQFKKLRLETRELKAERDNINENVHALKAQRDETRTTIQPVIEEIKAAREKITELRKKTPKRSQQHLQRELDDIEWKIQTTSLDPKEEKLLIENVKQLETQLSAYKKIEAQHKRIAELQQGLKAVDETGDKLHTELSSLAQKSQEIHQEMISKIEEAKKVREEADNAHSAFLLAREKTRLLEEERQKLVAEKMRIRELERQLRESQREEETASRKVAEKALKEKLGSEAREKLQSGKKLSWQEFQLLAEEDESET